jgi:hypothetical protein
MYTLLSVLAICITVIFVINSLHKNPITFVIHKKFEELKSAPEPLSEEDKKILEDQQQMTTGLNEVIKFTQEFLGGGVDAESEPKAK